MQYLEASVAQDIPFFKGTLRTMARDDTFNILVYITLLLDVASSLHLSKEAATILPGKTLAVSCRDKSGQAVIWRGPRGALGVYTRPAVKDSSIGKLLIFNNSQVDDTGNYTCSLALHPEERKVFMLKVEEEIIDLETATEFVAAPKPHTIKYASEIPEEDISDITTTTEYFAGPKPDIIRYTSEIPEEPTTIITKPPVRTKHPVHTKPKEYEQPNYSTSEEPIIFKDTKEVQSGVEGETITLRCEVSGPSKITWLIDQENITEPKYTVIGDGLVITNLSREDSGKEFICQALQINTGEIRSCKIKLIVEHQPYLLYAEDTELYAALDTKVNLTCEVEAQPQPMFEWFNLDRAKPRRIENFKLISNNLSILEVTKSEALSQNFKCLATNKHGTMEKFFTLHRGSPPAPPLEVGLVESTRDSLLLNFTLPNITEEEVEVGMQPIFLYIQYRTEDTDEWQFQEFNITQESFVLTDLKPKTEYIVRAATRNAAGFSDYSNAVLFQTSGTAGVSASKTVLIALIIPIFFNLNLGMPSCDF